MSQANTIHACVTLSINYFPRTLDIHLKFSPDILSSSIQHFANVQMLDARTENVL